MSRAAHCTAHSAQRTINLSLFRSEARIGALQHWSVGVFGWVRLSSASSKKVALVACTQHKLLLALPCLGQQASVPARDSLPCMPGTPSQRKENNEADSRDDASEGQISVCPAMPRSATRMLRLANMRVAASWASQHACDCSLAADATSEPAAIPSKVAEAFFFA